MLAARASLTAEARGASCVRVGARASAVLAWRTGSDVLHVTVATPAVVAQTAAATGARRSMRVADSSIRLMFVFK